MPGYHPDVVGDAVGKSKLHSELMDKFQTSARIRKPREAEWLVQKHFARGDQYASFSQQFGLRINPPSSIKTKPRLTYNYSRVVKETLLAYLLKNSPTFAPVASRGDMKSQNAAVLGRLVLRYYWMTLGMSEKLEIAGHWALDTGAAFAEVGWNPLGGPKVEVPDMQALTEMMGGVPMMMSPEQMPPDMIDKLPKKFVPAGDPYIRIRSPFEVFQDFGATTLEDAQWILTGTMRPVEEMQRLYEQQAEFIKPESADWNMTNQRQALDSFGAGQRGLDREKLNRCLVLEYWGTPTKEWPDGLRVIATRDGVIDVGPTPNGYDYIPFAMWCDRIVPGEFWPDGTMRDLISPQKELNKRISQVMELANRYTNKWLAVEGSVDPDKINDDANEVIEYQPGQRPEAVRPPDFPDGPLKMIQLTKEAIENASGATPALMGQMQGEERSGRQIAYKGMYAEGRIGLLASHLARFLSRTGSLLLRQIAANVTEPRVAKIVGKNREAQVRMFTGSDLADATDVIVEPASVLGFTRQERFDKVMQLVDRGALDQTQALEALELEDFANLTEDIAQDRNNALAEHERWRQMDFASEVLYFENHPIHLNTHNQFRKSAEYRALEPQAKAQVDAHCQVHESYVLGQDPNAPPPDQDPAAQGGGAAVESGAPAALPGQQSPAQQSASMKESGAEVAEGLPPVPAVPKPGSERPPA